MAEGPTASPTVREATRMQDALEHIASIQQQGIQVKKEEQTPAPVEAREAEAPVGGVKREAEAPVGGVKREAEAPVGKAGGTPARKKAHVAKTDFQKQFGEVVLLTKKLKGMRDESQVMLRQKRGNMGKWFGLPDVEVDNVESTKVKSDMLVKDLEDSVLGITPADFLKGMESDEVATAWLKDKRAQLDAHTRDLGMLIMPLMKMLQTRVAAQKATQKTRASKA